MNAYLPTGFVRRGPDVRVQWLKAAHAAFDEPFFSQTEASVTRAALGSAVAETRLDSLVEGAKPYKAPAGIIYHSSHCGSTLLANVLKKAPATLVLSEPPVFLGLLAGIQQGQIVSTYDALDVVRATLSALARGRDGRAEHVFVKLFSESIHQGGILRAAFPSTPEIFLYRDPIEILVSAARYPNLEWIWNERFTGLTTKEAVQVPVAELLARALGRNMAEMVSLVGPSTWLMNYTEIGADTPNQLVAWQNWAPSAMVITAMRRALEYDAKAGSQARWRGADSGLKQKEASPALRSLAVRYCEGPYLELERLRQSRRAMASASP